MACACLDTSRRRFAKRKSKAEALLQYNFPFQFSRTKSMRSIVWNPSQTVWNLALASMESMQSIVWNPSQTVWNQDRRKTENTACRLMPYADEPQFHTIRFAN